MDPNRNKSIDNIIDEIYNHIDLIHSAIIKQEYIEAQKEIDSVEECLKGLKQNLKLDEV